MANRERFTVEFAGQPAVDLYRDVTEVQVELDDEEAATFRVEVSIALGSDGAWSHADDERFTPWTPVTIRVAFDDGPRPLMSGYLTGIRTSFDVDRGRCRLELAGTDGSALLDRTERLRAWPDQKDSDIARAILSEHGLTPVVDDTAVVHDSAVSTIVQRETDLRFIRRLALRNGYECFVDGDSGYFRAPPGDQPPQPVLAVHFGKATNTLWFAVRVDAGSSAEIGMFGLDRADKTILRAVASGGGRPALGADRATDLTPATVPPARAYVAMAPSTGTREMEPLCRSLFEAGDWFVTGEGMVDGGRYRDVLRPRRPVTIKGVGARHSGVYDVKHVTHTINAGGYTQKFQVRRNGLGLTGAEDFGAGRVLGT